MAKVWKLYHSLFLRYPTAFSQNTFMLRKWLSFVPRTPEIPTSKSFQGAEHNGKGLKALPFTISEIPHSIFSKHILLRKWLSFIPIAPEIPTSKFSGVLNSMAKVWKLYHSPILRYPTAFSQNTCFSLESGFLSFLVFQKSLLVSFQGCWTQWQRFESSTIHSFWYTLHCIFSKHVLA